MNDDNDPFIHFDAAYALGALSDDDRDEFELHMAGCAECRARVAEIADLPALLAGLPESAYEAAAEVAAPPDTLLPNLLRQVRREQRRRRLIVTGLTAAVAACLVALAVLVWPSAQPARPTPRQMTAVAASPVQATAALVKRGWGTEIDLVCRYDESAHGPAVPYSLVVVDEHGARYPAGSWALQGGKQIRFTGGTAVALADIASVQITFGDRPILQLSP